MDYEQLKETFTTLLDAQCAEQVYQEFLERYPEFVPREFVQNHGVHFNLILRKVKFGNEFVSDFVYLSKSSSDWNVVLVELEKPQSRFFGSKGGVHGDFLVGIKQIARWRSWFADANNSAYFLNKTLGTIRVPLKENPCHIKYVLVTGRTEEARENPDRRREIGAHEAHDLKILSYDSLLHLEGRPSPRYVGVLRDGAIDLVSTQWAGDPIFSYLPPEQVNITDALRASCLGNRHAWLTRRVQDDRYVLEEKLPRIGSVQAGDHGQLAAAASRLGLKLI